MLRKKIYEETGFNVNESLEGETLEEKIQRIVENKEPITDGAPIIYTDRRKGVEPGYNIRTDRFDIAVTAMDAISRSNTAKRLNFYKNMEEQQKNETDKGNQKKA